jgi:MFS transporter, PAT family, beta-lactamase induction signal transducer AmpG
LWLSDRLPWREVYFILAGCMLIGMGATFAAIEPEAYGGAPRTLREAVVLPFVDFFKRSGAWLFLAFILLYKIGDSMASAMTTPFLLELGFTRSELAVVVKTFGLLSLLGGSLIGGALMLKIGISRALWVFGLLQALSILGFAWLASTGRHAEGLVAVVILENLSFGMGTSAYSAFMASLCNVRFSATQYALLSSLMGVPRVILSSPTGFLAQGVGWPGFFVLCAAAALPGMVLLCFVAPWKGSGTSNLVPG